MIHRKLSPFESRTGCIRLSVALSIAAVALAPGAANSTVVPNSQLSFWDPTGIVKTTSTAGGVDLQNPFFRPLGNNGRACAHCHQPFDAWGVSGRTIRFSFNLTGGTDPLFRPDAATMIKLAGTLVNNNTSAAAVTARKQAYKLLLEKGDVLTRISYPAAPDFTLISVSDPYLVADNPGINHQGSVVTGSDYLTATGHQVYVFRRPLPTTNEKFLTAVAWDGRDTVLTLPDGTAANDEQKVLLGLFNVGKKAIFTRLFLPMAAGATPPLSDAQENLIAQSMLDAQTPLFTAQSWDRAAGLLTESGARGGPDVLTTLPYYYGINDVLGADPLHPGVFNTEVFNLFDSWDTTSRGRFAPAPPARAAVARGQKLFNERRFSITGVTGINDFLNMPTVVVGCVTCHDAPNVGNHSTRLPIDIGINDFNTNTGQLQDPTTDPNIGDLPVFTFKSNSTGQTYITTDPGRMIPTGKFADRGKFKGPILHGLAAREPYFHNGRAQDLNAVVDFYNKRFSIGFTPQDKSDLVSFLQTL